MTSLSSPTRPAEEESASTSGNRPRITIRGNSSSLATKAVTSAFFLLIFFLFQGLWSGWHEGLKGVIGLGWILLGWFVTASLSLDARIVQDGAVVTRARVTERFATVSRCCGPRHWIRYTYTVDGIAFSNNQKASYQFQKQDEVFHNETSEEELEVYYLPHQPGKSLPRLNQISPLGGPNRAYPSAGSINGTQFTWSHCVFLLIVVACDVAGMIAFGKVTDNDLWQVFWGHAVGVTSACCIYYILWMKPREQQQRFGPTEDDTTSSAIR